MSNRVYFNYSHLHEDEIVDISKQEGVLVISKRTEDPDTNLMVANHNLINLLTTYETLSSDPATDEASLIRIVDRVINIVENTNLINYSSFCIYFQVIGYSYSTYMSEKTNMPLDEKRALMKELIKLYIDNRHGMYLSHGYSDQVLQVSSDTASSRRKSKTGIEKTEDVLLPLGFTKATNLNELRRLDLAYILPDKGQLDIFNNYLRENHIRFEFRETRDSKNPDMLLKVRKHIIIMEHKLTNGGGGSQNAEINEIIQFINYGEDNNNVHYISCLAGNFFKKLNAENHEPKAESQYRNVISNLGRYPNNYFVNGNGLAHLIEDFVNDNLQ